MTSRRLIFAFALPWTIALIPSPADAGWKAGTGRVAITPKEPMWMAGYASRTKPSEGAVHDLWAKALALEDPAGQRAILVTLDVCGIDRELSNRVRDTIASRHGLDRDRIVLACSHTHSGPVVGTNLLTMYKIDAEQRRRIADYAEFLVAAIVSAAGHAIDHLEESRLAWGTGRCDFAVNRRANKEAEVPDLRRRLALARPRRPRRPRVESHRGQRGSHRGRIRLRLPLHGPRFQPSSAEIMPGLPRSSSKNDIRCARRCSSPAAAATRTRSRVAHSTSPLGYGKQLAESVEVVLRGPLETIDGPIVTGYEEIRARLRLRCRPQSRSSTTPGQTTSTSPAGPSTSSRRSRAAARLDSTYPYPVASLAARRSDLDLPGGRGRRRLLAAHQAQPRLVAHLGFRLLQRRDGLHSFATRLERRRLRGGGAMVYYGLPTVWSDEVEETIMAAVARRSQVSRLARRPTPANGAQAPARPTPTP